MKKVIMILAAMLVGMSASAQTNWIEEVVEADELKGTPRYEMYIYYAEESDFAFTYGSTMKIVLFSTLTGIFDYDDNWVMGILIGYYKDGVLVKKEKAEGWKNDPDCIKFMNNYGRPMIEWLESGGDVRIIAPRYNRTDLDVTIPHRK